jgi:ABC-type transporter Mla subunit MlaD
MSSQRLTDVLIGTIVIGAVLVLVITFVLTKGWNKRQFDLYMRTESARDLTSDTQVLLQSLPVGEVKAVAPQVDSLTGRLRFIVHLRIDERYQDGTELRLPLGTQADMVTANVLGGVSIELRMPDRPVGTLAAGDTIGSTVRSSGLDAIAQIADSLRQQIALVLTDTRTLIENLSSTVVLAEQELRQTAPQVRATMSEVQASLAQLRPTLARADTLMATATNRMDGVSDSIAATLAQTKGMIAHLDSLALTATAIAGENRAVVRTTAENLFVISAKLEHFLDQVSRRPLRMLYGVRPLPDTIRPAPPSPAPAASETSAKP